MPDSRLFPRSLLWVVAIIALLGIALVVLSEDAEAVSSISLSIQGSDTQTVDPGSSANFKVNVTNLLTTTTLTVNLSMSAAPTHWTALLSQTQISVSALATKTFTLTVGVPSNASADAVGKQIIVTADPDFGDTETITTTTKVAQIYGIQTSSATSIKHTVGGSAVTFTLIVNNTGNGQDTVSVTHSGEPSAWTVSHVSSVTISAGGSKSVTISVVPPSSTSSGTYQTTVKATSGDTSTNDQTTFIIIIDPVYGLSLSSSDVSKYVTPNEPAYYSLSVTNTGNTADNAIITIVNAPTGWTVLPTSNPVALNPNETKAFQVLVTAPNTVVAGTQVQITINATSNGNVSIVRQLSINAVVNQVYDPRVSPLSNNKVVSPGSSVTFKINVTNRGNGDDTVDLSLSGVPTGQGWVYNFNPVSITLTPGQTKTVDLTFTIGSRAAYGDNLVTVRGTSHGTTTSGNTTVVVSVSQYYNLALVPDGASTLRVDPGGSLTFNLTVTNTGNGPDDITFQALRLDSTWVSYFSKTTVYNLPANSSAATTLSIEIPSTTNAGTYRFDVKATSDGNSSVSRTIINLTLIVNQLFAVNIDPATSFISGPPGTGISLDLTVTNDGSGADNVTLSAPGSYASWVQFSSSTVPLDPKASTTVTATITPPIGTVAGDVSIIFRATSKGRTTVNDEATVDLSVTKMYKAKLTAVEASLHKKPTETATFTIQLKNDGNTPDTFKVNFTSNPRTLASHSLSSAFVSLNIGATRTFTVTMTVPSGEPVGNLRFVLLATSENDTAAAANVTLTVIVDPVHAVELVSYDATAKAEPTDSDVVELRVKNTGNGQDTFALRAIGPNYRWVAFEKTQVTVAAMGEMVVNMTITLPDTDVVSVGTYYINITATSTGDPTVTKTMEIIVTVVHKEDLDLTAADLIRRRSTDPGASVAYLVKVENLGLKAHVVNLALSGTEADWAGMNKTLLIVPAGESRQAKVTVTVPDGTSPQSFDIIVTGTFDDNEARMDSITLITTVNKVHGVTVELNDTTVAALPGEMVNLVFNVNNTGNAQDIFDIKVDVDKIWFTFSPKVVTVAAGANVNVTVTIIAPVEPLAASGMHYFNVSATSQGNTSVSTPDVLEFEVEQVYDVMVKTLPARQAVDPAQSAKFNITIMNEGNGKDTFELTIEGTRKAWGKLSISQVELEAGAETVVVLTVRIPSNQPVEDVTLFLEATSSGGDNVTAKVSTLTTINPFYGVGISISNPSKEAFPGKWAAFKVKVKNTGNSPDTFNFEVTGDYAAWVADLDPLTIEPGKIKTLDFNITPPEDIANGIYIFNLNASSDTQGDAYDTLEMEVNINVYHGLTVELSEIEVDSRPEAIETVQIFVTNTGNVNDTFDVRALGVYSSWVSIDNMTLDADEGASAEATATIEVNATLSNDYIIKFEVTSHAGGNVTEVEFKIKILLSYGVGLIALKEDVPAAPNTTVRVEVELTNEGNIEDTFDLNVPQVPGSLWEASTEVDDLTVAAGETTWFNVTIDVPDGVNAGAYVIRVRATSTKAPSLTSTTINLNLTVLFNVSASGPVGTVSFEPGESRIVQVTVKNEGLGRDTIELEVDEAFEDWAVLDVTAVILGPGASTVVNVAVTPPVDALAGTYVVKVEARSASDITVTDIADIRVKVLQIYGVRVELETAYVEGVAGVWHDIMVSVFNTGNGEDIITLDGIVPSGVPIEVRFDRSILTIDAGRNTTVTMRIKADMDAVAKAHALLFQARSSSTTVLPVSADFTYTIPAFSSASVLTAAGQSEMGINDAVVGRSYQETIEVFNLGNGVDTFSMVVTSDDPDLPSWFTFEDNVVDIDPGKSVTMLVTITVPSTTVAMTYEYEIRAKSLNANESGILSGYIEIEPDRSVIISTDDAMESINPKGTTPATFDITVHNNGNVQETVTLSVGTPGGWQTPILDPETVTVAAYGTSTITISFSTSAIPGSAVTTNAITVKAIYGPYDSPILNLVLTVLKPEIGVDKLVMDKLDIKDGDEVSVTITVENTGQVAASGITVILLGSSEGIDYEIARSPPQSVSAMGTTDVTFLWEVDESPEAVVTIKVRFLPDDIVYSHAETIVIAGGDESITDKILGLPFLVVIVMGLLIGLIVGLMIAATVRKGYKRRLESARAAGVAEGLSLASDETLGLKGDEDEEGIEGDEGDEEPLSEEDGTPGPEEEGAEEDEAAEEEEDVPPVTVQCPKCDTLNAVTTAQRPYEFRCEKCNALLRLKT